MPCISKTARPQISAVSLPAISEHTELTQTIVNEYIKKIIIHAPDKSGGKRRQKVEIIFNFVDEVDIPMLAEPMIAESTLGRRKTA